MNRRSASTAVVKLTRAFLRVLPFVALLWLLGEAPVAAQGTPPTPRVPDAAPTMAAALAQNGARISYHAQTGKVRFIGADPGRPIGQPAVLPPSASREDAARGFLSVYGPLFGLTDQRRELIVKREKAADRGRGFVRFQQVYNNIPIFGGELIVQLDARNNVLSANGEALPDITVSTTPAITAATARQSALDLAAKWYNLPVSDLTATQPELWIYNPALVGPDTRATALVWRVEVRAVGQLPIWELVLIDAQRGSTALHFNQFADARNRQTYTANGGTSLPGTFVCDESNPTCTGGDAHATGAHVNAGYTYNFYATNFGRDSIDNAGMTIISTVHYGFNVANAGWSGTQMVYGDAYGFPLADDVVAHELTHGVTQYESNLFYYYQSGAINESLSDVFGEFVDLTNGAGNDGNAVKWLLGEEISGLGAIRSMKNPPAFGDPDKMTSPYYYKGFDDGGGVHVNSGLNNKAAYLMTDGDLFNGRVVTGLGITKVANIYYEVQTNLLTSGADYADLYEALYQGCLNLIGTAGIIAADCQEVRDATDAVEMNQQPAANFNTDAPLCPAGSIVETTLFFDDLESGDGNWTYGGTPRWQYDMPPEYGSFAHSGLHYLYADDYPDTTATAYATMNVSFPVSVNAYLHFAHAYGFEYYPGYYFDGGALDYSTDGGSDWKAVPSSWFEVNGYDGMIYNGSGNALGGRLGFLAESHGYISSRLNLSALAGQNVRFRWVMGLDMSGYYWGWWLDDVRLYTCISATAAPRRNYFTTATPTLTWNRVTWATYYEIQVDNNANFSSPEYSSPPIPASTLEVTTNLPADGVYYWRVRAKRADNTWGAWSAVDTFVVDILQ